MATEYISVADTAKMVRQALKVNFPGVKFSVRSKSYSGGASITVSWTDGPSTPQVEAVTGKFEGASFDGMQDLKTFVQGDLDGRKVHFGSDYVFYRREYTVPFLTRVVAETCKRWGIKVLPTVTNTASGSAEVVTNAASQQSVDGGNGSYHSSIDYKIYEAAFNKAA